MRIFAFLSAENSLGGTVVLKIPVGTASSPAAKILPDVNAIFEMSYLLGVSIMGVLWRSLVYSNIFLLKQKI